MVEHRKELDINHFKVKTKMEGTQESPYTTECFKRNKQ